VQPARPYTAVTAVTMMAGMLTEQLAANRAERDPARRR